MQQDAILCLGAGCHLNFLERQVKFNDADGGFRHNETEGRRGRTGRRRKAMEEEEGREGVKEVARVSRRGADKGLIQCQQQTDTALGLTD